MPDAPTYGVPAMAFWVIPEAVGTPVVSDPRMVILYFEGFNGAGDTPILKFIDDTGVVTRMLMADDSATDKQVPYMDDGRTFPSILKMSSDLLYMILDGNLYLGVEDGSGAVNKRLICVTGASGGHVSIGATNATDDGNGWDHTLPQANATAEGQAVVAISTSNQWGYQTADICLAKSVSVNLNSTTKQTLYTVPASRSCIITKVVKRDASAAVTTAVGAFGFNANADDVVASFNVFDKLTGTTVYDISEPRVAAVKGSATNTFGYKGSVAEGAARTMTVDVFGYLL